jgi:hypothetical protein
MLLLVSVTLGKVSDPWCRSYTGTEVSISAHLTVCYGRFAGLCFVYEKTVSDGNWVDPRAVVDAILKSVPNKATLGKCDVMFNNFNVVRTNTSKN